MTESGFRRLAFAALVATYLVVVAGSIVRSTGAGMGCPDWPRCFGRWIPPTEVSQLPANYDQIFGEKLKGEVVFNAAKTWTEYANRLVGVVAGLLVAAMTVTAFSFRKKDRYIPVLAVLSLLLMAFQGWLGAQVVAFELKPVVVTIHMVVAIVILFLLIAVLVRSSARPVAGTAGRQSGLLWVLALTFVQVMLGTQLREVIDMVIVQMGYAARPRWVEAARNQGVVFELHRIFSVVVAIAALWWVWSARRQADRRFRQLAYVAFLAIGVEIASGMGLAYAGMPAALQPLHLTLALLLLGLEFGYWMLMQRAQSRQPYRAAAPVLNL